MYFLLALNFGDLLLLERIITQKSKFGVVIHGLRYKI